MCKLSLNQNLTKINTTTKTLWANVNGVWTDLHIKAWYDAIPVWVDGNFGIEVSNGVYRSQSTFTTTSAFTRDGNLLKATLTSGTQSFTLVSEEQIDTSAYSRVVVKTSKGNFELDISSYTQSAYFAIVFYINAQNIPTISARFANTKADFAVNTYGAPNGISSAGTTISISEITIE